VWLIVVRIQQSHGCIQGAQRKNPGINVAKATGDPVTVSLACAKARQKKMAK